MKGSNVTLCPSVVSYLVIHIVTTRNIANAFVEHYAKDEYFNCSNVLDRLGDDSVWLSWGNSWMGSKCKWVFINSDN